MSPAWWLITVAIGAGWFVAGTAVAILIGRVIRAAERQRPRR